MRFDRRVAVMFLLVVLALWLPRSLALDRYATVDEPRWLVRSANFYTALSRFDPRGTFQREHPGVTITWAGVGGYLLRFPGYFKVAPAQSPTLTQFHRLLRDYKKSPLDILVAARGWVILGAVAAFGVAFLLTVRLLGAVPALFAFALIAFDPYMVALTRILQPDGLLSPLMFVSLLAFLCYLDLGRNTSDLLLSAAAAGLAWLTKSPAFFLAPFFGLLLGGQILGSRLKRRLPGFASGDFVQMWRDVSPWLIWLVGAAAVFVLLWPAMWVDPLGSLRGVFSMATTYASEGHDSSLFFGGVIYPGGDPPWSFYPAAYLWRSTPVALVGLCLAVLALVDPSRRWLSAEHHRLIVKLLLFAILFIGFISLGEKKFDRYLLPVFAPLTLVAAIGWLSLLAKVAFLRDRQPVQLGLAAIVCAVQMAGLVQAYPYYLNAYNPLLGGDRTAAQVLMIGWGEGLDQAARYLNERPGRSRVSVWYRDGCFSYFSTKPSFSYDVNATLDDVRSSDYLLIYRDQWQRKLPSAEFLERFKDVEPEHIVTIGNLDYVWVYNLHELKGMLGESLP